MGSMDNLQWKIIAQDEASVTLKKVERAQKELADEVEKSNKAFKNNSNASGAAGLSLGKLVGGVALGTAAFTAAVAVMRTVTTAAKNFAVASVKSALEVEKLEASTRVLAHNMGWTEERVDSLVLSIREQNKSMREALQMSNSVIKAGLNEADAQRLLTAARDVGAASGKSSAIAAEQMTTAINRLTPNILSSVEMTVSERIAYAKMAEERGKTVAQLTVEEKKRAVFNEIMEQAEKVQGSYNAAMSTGIKKMGSASDAFEDVRTVAGKLIVNAIEPLADRVLKAIREFRAWAFTSDNELNPSLKAMANVLTKVVIVAMSYFIDMVVATSKVLFAFFDNWTKASNSTAEKTAKDGAKQVGVLRWIGATYLSTMGMLGVTFKVMARTLGNVASFVGDVAKNAFNVMVDWIQKKVDSALKYINILVDAYNKVGSKMGLGNIDNVSLDLSSIKADIGFGGEMAQQKAIIDDAMADMDQIADTVNEFMNKVPASEQIAGALAELQGIFGGALKDDTGGGGGAGKKAEEMADKITDAMQTVADEYDKGVAEVGDALFKLESDHEKTMNKINEKINGLRTNLAQLKSDYSSTVADLNRQEAERVITEEQAISNLRDQIAKEEDRLAKMRSNGETVDTGDLEALKNKLQQQQDILNTYFEERTGLDEELAEARRRASLSDFERFMEDLNLRREAEQARHNEKVMQIEAEILELEEQAAHEQAMYDIMRNEYMKTLEAFGVFHDGYIEALQNVEAQTEKSVQVMKKRLEEIINIVKAIGTESAKAGFAGSITSGAPVSSPADTLQTVNNTTIEINGVSVKDKSDIDALVAEIKRQIELGQLNAA